MNFAIPYRSDDEPLAAVAGHARLLATDEERATVRQLVLDARLDGLATAGQLLARLEDMNQDERRALLDRARTEVGLPTIGQLEAQARWESAQGAGLRASAVFTACHAAGCEALATRDGALIRPDVRRWFCERHADQATPEDKLPRGLGLRALPQGGYTLEDDPEAAAQEAAAASRQAQREAHEATRAAEAEGRDRHQAAMRAQRERELPAHLRSRT